MTLGFTLLLVRVGTKWNHLYGYFNIVHNSTLFDMVYIITTSSKL